MKSPYCRTFIYGLFHNHLIQQVEVVTEVVTAEQANHHSPEHN